MTQEDVAARAHVFVQMIRRLESGKANPALGTLAAVANALQVSLRDLLYKPPSLRDGRESDGKEMRTAGFLIVRRDAVRVVVVDPSERILPLGIRESTDPNQTTVWELPGGGIEADESCAEAAARELAEETGLVRDAADVAAPSWFRHVTFLHCGTRRIQDEAVVAIRLGHQEPHISTAQQLPDELSTFVGAKWATIAEIENGSERYFPEDCPPT